ncbi:MAG TPA: glycerate kinase [Microbacteriaceae bacterium]|nr:glycerate kinase [Microbacteriaceae bacterium]
MARIVIAPDSFKGTLDAAAAAAAIADGWASVRPDDDLLLLPQADGGEGTLDAIAAATPGARVLDAGLVTGPHGAPVPAHWLQLPDGTAVVELAVSSGITLMLELDALGATTRGLGEVIRRAVEEGASRLVIAAGGSASTDGATGALAALGARFLDADGRELPDGGGALARLATIDVSGLVAVPPARVLSDVTAPLTGPGGAAAVFGPQKGATPEDVEALDAALARLAEVSSGARARAPHEGGAGANALGSSGSPPLAQAIDERTPGGGSAGGTGYGLAAFLGARIEPGAAAIADLTGLSAALGTADLVVTGEGRYDAQSSIGKVAGHAIAAARAAGARVAVVAGALGSDAVLDAARGGPDELLVLADLAGGADRAIAEPARWLREAGAGLATAFSP